MRTLARFATIGIMVSTAALAVDTIKLRDEKTGEEYGPVKVMNGAKINIAGNTLEVVFVEQTAAQQALEKKLKAIIIPSIELRQASLLDAVKFLNESAIASDPEKKGVNIILKIHEIPEGGIDSLPLITINLRRVSLYDALTYCGEVLGLRMQINDDAVVLTHVAARQAIKKKTEAQKAIEKKLKAIIIPEIEFRQVSIADAVKFLDESAIANDPEKKGVNIVLVVPPGDFAAMDDVFAIDGFHQMLITMSLRRVSLYDALKYSCDVAGLRMLINDDGVILTR